MIKITGRKLLFRAFHPEGTLHVILFDLEVAQLQGFGDSLIPLNDPEISGITSKDPFVLLQYVTRTCTVHFDRSVYLSN